MDSAIRYWDWRDNPNEPSTWGPEVRLVMCAPPLDTACGGGLFGHTCGPVDAEVVRAHVSALDAFDYAYRSGRRMVVHVDDYDPAGPYPDAIPALTIRTQADLDGRRCGLCIGSGDVATGLTGLMDPRTVRCPACSGTGTIGGIRALLAVQAERRAIVCSPREEIDLSKVFYDLTDCDERGFCEHCGERVRIVSQGVICACCGEGAEPADCEPIDLVIIRGETGPDARPMHPDHVRGIVAQCKAAGVPVVLKWGDWVDELSEQCSDPTSDRMVFCKRGWTGWPGTDAFALHLCDCGDSFVVACRVGSDRSGSKLDGAEVCELPEWVTAS